MDIIARLLERFKHLKDPSIEKESVANTLTFFLKNDVRKESIELRNGNLKIKNLSPILRHIVFLKQTDIVSLLNKEHPHITINKIVN